MRYDTETIVREFGEYIRCASSEWDDLKEILTYITYETSYTIMERIEVYLSTCELGDNEEEDEVLQKWEELKNNNIIE